MKRRSAMPEIKFLDDLLDHQHNVGFIELMNVQNYPDIRKVRVFNYAIGNLDINRWGASSWVTSVANYNNQKREALTKEQYIELLTSGSSREPFVCHTCPMRKQYTFGRYPNEARCSFEDITFGCGFIEPNLVFNHELNKLMDEPKITYIYPELKKIGCLPTCPLQLHVCSDNHAASPDAQQQEEETYDGPNAVILTNWG